ncbi:PepSY domain-containing protein [Limimaricola soesokkakensis]|nr:PepSY domain-containing protein [Limimaricola soesokkakensis]
MRKVFMAATAFVALGATPALASPKGEMLMQKYRAAEYTRVEIKEGPTQYKVEAVKNGRKVEVVYDRKLRILKKEYEKADADDDRPRYRIRSKPKDFVRVRDHAEKYDDDHQGDRKWSGKGQGGGGDKAENDDDDQKKGRGKGRDKADYNNDDDKKGRSRDRDGDKADHKHDNKGKGRKGKRSSD